MKPWLVFVAFLALSPLAAAQEHTATVAQAKAILVAQGADLTTPCGAWAITDLTAWLLRAEGAGILDKPTGNQCQGYSVDVIIYKTGKCFDVLVDSTGANTPAWNELEGLCDVARWRAPIDLTTVTPPPAEPPCPPCPPCPGCPPCPACPPPPVCPPQVPCDGTNVTCVGVSELQGKVIELQGKLDVLTQQERLGTEAIRADVKAHRDAVSSVWKKVLMYIVPSLLGVLGIAL